MSNPFPRPSQSGSLGNPADNAVSSLPLTVVEMLQSLHSLQQENQRLQDQILSLTAKRERLQLLNTELAVPFPPHVLSNQGSMHTSAQINFLSSTQGQTPHLLRPPSCRVRGHVILAASSSPTFVSALVHVLFLAPLCFCQVSPRQQTLYQMLTVSV